MRDAHQPTDVEADGVDGATRTSEPRSTQRPMLSRDVIAEAAMELARRSPTTPLTLNRLGAALGADPTAIYRHYRNRNDLIIDLTDRAYSDVSDAVPEDPDWRVELIATATRLRDQLLLTPALSAELGLRNTGGPNEARLIERMAGLLVRAGFQGDQRLHVRAIGSMVLSHVVLTASMLLQGPDTLAMDMAMVAKRDGVDEPPDPRTHADNTFEQMLRTHVAGLEHAARCNGPAA